MKLNIRRFFLICSLMFITIFIATIFISYWLILPVYKFTYLNDNIIYGNEKIWCNAQKVVNRIGWQHDASFYIGEWGGYEWAQQMIKEISEYNIEDYHIKYSSLSMITNKNIGIDNKLWISWWKNNKNKSQEDWIKEGFKDIGINLGDDLKKEDAISLLKILGEEKQQKRLKFNAFRWLRDSDFNVDLFNYKDIPHTDGNIILNGLKKYCHLVTRDPKDRFPHVLNIGKENRFTYGGGFPLVYSTSFIIILFVFLLISFVSSILFFIKAVKFHKK